MKEHLQQFINSIYLYNSSIDAGLQGQEAFVPIAWAVTVPRWEIVTVICKDERLRASQVKAVKLNWFSPQKLMISMHMHYGKLFKWTVAHCQKKKNPNNLLNHLTYIDYSNKAMPIHARQSPTHKFLFLLPMYPKFSFGIATFSVGNLRW